MSQLHACNGRNLKTSDDGINSLHEFLSDGLPADSLTADIRTITPDAEERKALNAQLFTTKVLMTCKIHFAKLDTGSSAVGAGNVFARVVGGGNLSKLGFNALAAATIGGEAF